jgi:uncharacterized protein (TIGR02996 family)
MTDDHAPFLAAIAAHPGDAAPRLIYADWLEEQGDTARAEAWRWLVKEKRQPAELKKGQKKAIYCWVVTTILTEELPRILNIKTTCFLSVEIFTRLRSGNPYLFTLPDNQSLVLAYKSVCDAEFAAIEAMAELIREAALQPST